MERRATETNENVSWAAHLVREDVSKATCSNNKGDQSVRTSRLLIFVVSEDAFHELPLLVTAGGGGGTLELGYVGLPLSLTRQLGETGHVA